MLANTTSLPCAAMHAELPFCAPLNSREACTLSCSENLRPLCKAWTAGLCPNDSNALNLPSLLTHLTSSSRLLCRPHNGIPRHTSMHNQAGAASTAAAQHGSRQQAATRQQLMKQSVCHRNCQSVQVGSAAHASNASKMCIATHWVVYAPPGVAYQQVWLL
jgi:hypothetical protein